MTPRSSLALWKRLCMAALLLGPLGCAYKVTEDECARYRDKLRTFRAARGTPEDPEALDRFMQSCVGATVSRGAHACMEKSNDETSFFRCLE